MVEHSLGKGEVVSSILTGSTTNLQQKHELQKRALPCLPRFAQEQVVISPRKLGENQGTLFDRCSAHGSPSSVRTSAPSSLSNETIKYAPKLANIGYRRLGGITTEARLIGAFRTHATASDIAHVENVTAAQGVEGGRSVSCFLSLPQNEVARCAPH